VTGELIITDSDPLPVPAELATGALAGGALAGGALAGGALAGGALAGGLAALTAPGSPAAADDWPGEAGAFVSTVTADDAATSAAAGEPVMLLGAAGTAATVPLHAVTQKTRASPAATGTTACAGRSARVTLMTPASSDK
jgi:hypothetical protein